MADLPDPNNKQTQIQYQPGNAEFIQIKLLQMILEQLKEIAYYTSHLEKKENK